LTGLTIQTAVGVAGVLLVIFGLRGKRTGREPRCARCAYDLTGLTSDRCPECGVTIGPKTTRQGLWRRRTGCLLAGASLLILEVASVAVLFRSMDLLARAPFSVVMLVAKLGESEAMLELSYRYNRHRLDEEELSDLAEAALVGQFESQPSVAQRLWSEILQQMHDAGQLNRQQRDRYYESVVDGYAAETRERVAPGTTFPIALSRSLRNPHHNLDTVVTGWRVTYHGTVMTGSNDWEIPPVPTRLEWNDPLLMPAALRLEPGRYRLDLVVISALYPGQSDLPDPLWTGETVLPLELEVVGTEAGGDVVVIDQPELAEDFRRALFQAGSYFNPAGFTSIVRWRSGGRGGVELRLMDVVLNDPVPVDASFRVALRARSAESIGDAPAEQEIGYVICYAGSATAYALLALDAHEIQEQAASGDLAFSFIGDPDVARRTLNVYETWNGTVRLAARDAPLPFRPPAEPLR
jgi:hypothetical protein